MTNSEPLRVRPYQSSFSSRMELSAFIEETSSDVDHYFSTATGRPWSTSAACHSEGTSSVVDHTGGQHTSSSSSTAATVAGKSIDTGYQSNIILGQTSLADAGTGSDVPGLCDFHLADVGGRLNGVADMSVEDGGNVITNCLPTDMAMLRPHLHRLDDTDQGMRCD